MTTPWIFGLLVAVCLSFTLGRFYFPVLLIMICFVFTWNSKVLSLKRCCGRSEPSLINLSSEFLPFVILYWYCWCWLLSLLLFCREHLRISTLTRTWIFLQPRMTLSQRRFVCSDLVIYFFCGRMTLYLMSAIMNGVSYTLLLQVIRRLMVNIKPKDFGTLISGSPGEDMKMVATFKDLMERIFVLDPDKRLNVSQALSHPFITGKWTMILVLWLQTCCCVRYLYILVLSQYWII